MHLSDNSRNKLKEMLIISDGSDVIGLHDTGMG